MTPWEQMEVGVVIALPSAALGLLAYRRSRHTDKVAEQSGMATESRAGTTQIIDGLNQLIDQLQDDNQDWRAKFTELRGQLESCFGDRQTLQREVNRMYRKYGENGNTPPDGTPVVAKP